MDVSSTTTTMPTKLLLSWSLSEKLIFGFHMGTYGAGLLFFVEKYIFNDWDFLISLFILVFLDTIFGCLKAVKEKRFKVRAGLTGFALKIIILACTVFAIGVIDNSRIAGESTWFQGYVDAGAFAIMLGFEGASVLRNLYALKPSPIIEFVLKKLDLLTYIEKNDKA